MILTRRFPWLRALPMVLASWMGAEAGSLVEFHGMANASAGVPISTNGFLTGCDEDNVLKVFPTQGGFPVAQVETSPLLGLQTRNGQADFEGAARLGDVVFWLGSHGRNSSGEPRPDRQRLLALRIQGEAAETRLEPVGRPVATLLQQLTESPLLADLDLRKAVFRAPGSEGGLNFEGLAAGPDKTLLLGLRTPLKEGRAILIPLQNPFEVLEGKPAQFASPHLLDLEGRGIRDLVWTGNGYFILAGSTDRGGKTHLYSWSGAGGIPRRIEKTPQLKDLNPEGLVLFGEGESRRLLVLSDDGNLPRNQTPDPRSRSFRGVWIPIPSRP